MSLRAVQKEIFCDARAKHVNMQARAYIVSQGFEAATVN